MAPIDKSDIAVIDIHGEAIGEQGCHSGFQGHYPATISTLPTADGLHQVCSATHNLCSNSWKTTGLGLSRTRFVWSRILTWNQSCLDPNHQWRVLHGTQGAVKEVLVHAILYKQAELGIIPNSFLKHRWMHGFVSTIPFWSQCAFHLNDFRCLCSDDIPLILPSTLLQEINVSPLSILLILLRVTGGWRWSQLSCC